MTIEIPWQPTLRRPVGPPERIELPTQAYARIGVDGTLLIVLAVVLVPLTVGGGGLLVYAAATKAASSFGDLLWLLILIAMMAFGFCLLAGVVTLIADSERAGPVLTIADDGFIDTRLLTQPVPWSAVAQASILYQDPFARMSPAVVRLVLRTDVAARHNPFRIGLLACRWRRHPNELHVPLMMLTTRRYILANVTVSLVRRHGGVVE